MLKSSSYPRCRLTPWWRRTWPGAIPSTSRCSPVPPPKTRRARTGAKAKPASIPHQRIGERTAGIAWKLRRVRIKASRKHGGDELTCAVPLAGACGPSRTGSPRCWSCRASGCRLRAPAAARPERGRSECSRVVVAACFDAVQRGLGTDGACFQLLANAGARARDAPPRAPRHIFPGGGPSAAHPSQAHPRRVEASAHPPALRSDDGKARDRARSWGACATSCSTASTPRRASPSSSRCAAPAVLEPALVPSVHAG